MDNHRIPLIHFLFTKSIHPCGSSRRLEATFICYFSAVLLSFLFGFTAGAQDSISIGSASVTPSTSEVVLPVNLTVDRDISLLSLTINFDSAVLGTSTENVVAVPERFPGGSIDDITSSVDNENGVISWTVSDFLGGSVIEAGAGTLFTIEFSLNQVIDAEGTIVELTEVQATDTLLDTVALAVENGMISVSDDSDEDGLPDDWEMEHFGDLRFSGDDDPDRDGQSNLDELNNAGDPFAVELQVNRGWNLLSLGITKQDNSIQGIFGDRIVGVVWVWDSDQQRYTPAETILPENGYWVYSKADFLDNNPIVIELP